MKKSNAKTRDKLVKHSIMVKRTLTNNLSKEEKKILLSTQEGKKKLLDIYEETCRRLYENIAQVKTEIKNVESIAISWINLTIVLTIFQILPLEKSEMTKDFIVSCLPSFIILIYSIAFTLLKSPSSTKPEFAVIQKEDIDMRLATSEAEIEALTYIHSMLHKNYERKTQVKKFIAPSAIVNFTISILFIIAKTFYPQTINITFCAILGILSIFSIYLLFWKLSFSKTISKKIPLNEP